MKEKLVVRKWDETFSTRAHKMYSLQNGEKMLGLWGIEVKRLLCCSP